jgi:hypothetical protein
MVSAVAQTATYTLLPSTFTAKALSRNGKVVVGVDTNTDSAAYWSNGTVTDLPALTGAIAYSCNEDGSVIVGSFGTGGNMTIPFVDNNGTVTFLPLLGGSVSGFATLISANGLTIAGYCDGEPVVWSASGAQLIPNTTASSVLNCISDDGSTIVADLFGNYSTSDSSVEDSYSVGVINVGNLGKNLATNSITPYTPVVTNISAGPTGIEDLYCLTSDGSIQFGGGFNLYLFQYPATITDDLETSGFWAIVNTGNTSSPLGSLSDFEIHSCSGDGSVLGGYPVSPELGPDPNDNTLLFGFSTFNAALAFGGNVVDLHDYLQGKGAANVANILLNVPIQGMSGDGSVILGTEFSGVAPGSFIATITPAISGLNLDQGSFVGGSSVQATVGLDYPAPANTTVRVTSNNTAVIPNASVSIQKGAMLGAFTVSSSSVTAPVSVILTATLGSASAATSVTVNPSLPAITGFYPSAGVIVGGNAATASITLASAAGAAGDSVSLSSNTSGFSVPSAVKVLSGKTSASFSLTSTPVSSVTKVILTATLGSSTETTVVTVVPPSVSLVRVAPASVTAGSNTMIAVYLNGMAPLGGTLVNLVNSNSGAAQITSFIIVPTGATAANSQVTTADSSSSSTVVVNATTGSVTVTTSFTIDAPFFPQITSFYPSASVIVGGNAATATIQIANHSSVPYTISIFGDTAGYTGPASVTIPAGTQSTTFALPTSPVATPTTIQISAFLGQFAESTQYTVIPPSVSLVRVAPSPVVGGVSTKVAVYLNGKAPTGGFKVNVASSNAAAVVPTSITVPAGATAANATVTTSKVTASTTVVVTAKTGSTSVETTMVVNP